MSYDYKEDVVGSLVRCHVCGKAKTRGESCTACQQRMDAVEGTIKMFAEKDSELVRLRAELLPHLQQKPNRVLAAYPSRQILAAGHFLDKVDESMCLQRC